MGQRWTLSEVTRCWGIHPMRSYEGDLEAGEMVYWLRAHTALADDLSLVLAPRWIFHKCLELQVQGMWYPFRPLQSWVLSTIYMHTTLFKNKWVASLYEWLFIRTPVTSPSFSCSLISMPCLHKVGSFLIFMVHYMGPIRYWTDTGNVLDL